MLKLIQFRLCPRSRSIRLALAELKLDAELIDEKPWEYRPGFLAINPAGELPVLEFNNSLVLCGAYSIAEFLDEEAADSDLDIIPIVPGNREDRAEVRRLIDWFHGKFEREVTTEILFEKVSGPQGAGGSPNADALRAARANLRYHMSYISYLADQRRWLAGDQLSYADMAAAAHLSVADYVGEVPWNEYPIAKAWYQRVKSRPSFRPLLADRLAGLPPAAVYTDLDF